MIFNEGQKLNRGKYTIKKRLPEGGGGFGITYLAEDERGNSTVIKTLNYKNKEHDNWEKLKDNFWDEAKILRKFNHQHIVKFYDFFIHDQEHEDLYCIVMEYIKGENIETYVEKNEFLSEVDALLYIKQIGEALTIVHDKGLLHRDVKPRNIMLRQVDSKTFEAVLIDFGIAREFLPGQRQRHTAHRSEGYAPIEQYEEEAERNVCTDIYALAATLYYMLTKRNPPSAEYREWNLDTRELIKTLIGHAGQVLSVDISPDGKILVSGSIDGTIKTWKLDTFKQIRTFGDCFSSDIINYSRQHINPLIISRDGQTIINGIANSTIKVWCLKTGKTLRTISLPELCYWDTYVNSVCLSPEQAIIASNSQEEIKVWDFDSGELRHNLTGHCGMVYCLAISPDGQTLASGCEDYTIKLWNLKTGELIYTLGDDQSEFRGDTSPVYSVAFSPDGQTLISGQRNGMIKIWRVPLKSVSSDTIPS